jgi:tripartite-type tricarboxylate transporter receptor subunit TctC
MKSKLPVAQKLGAVLFAAACALGLAFAGAAQAQEYRGIIRILVGYPPGGTIDNTARVLADKMKTELGQNVIVENRPGAGGQISATALKAAPADGSTLLLANDHQAAIIPLTMASPGYDAATDFVPVGMVAYFEASLGVHPRTNAKNLAEYIAWVKANPKESSMGIPAPASIPEFMVGVLGKAAGVELTSIPYKGGAAMVQDLIGGRLPAGISTPGEMLPHVTSGRVHIIAVAGTHRSAFLPDVPTFTEAGIRGLEEGSFLAFYAPANTPRAVVQRYNKAVNAALAMPDVQERFKPITMVATPSTPEEMGTRVAQFRAVWTKIIKDSGFTPK